MGKLITWVIVIAVIVIGGFAIFGGPTSEAQTIKIGAIMPLTGDAAQYGESENRALQIAVEEINKAGGVHGEDEGNVGRKIELIVEDGKCDPQAAGTAAKKLVEFDKVKIIIGGACSGETLAAAKITEPAKVILLSPSASSPDVTKAGDFVFRTYPSDALSGRIAASYSINELKAKRAAVFTELTDYSQGLREVFKKAFEDLGGEVVSDETYTTGDTDFKTQALKIKSEKPDVIYIVPQTSTPGVAILKQFKENGIKTRVLTAEVLISDREFAKDNSKILEGLIGVEPAIDWENNPKAKALLTAHKEKFGNDPGPFSANTYDAVYLIYDALETVTNPGSVDFKSEDVRDFLYKVKNWPGAVGPLTLDENGDPLLGENVRKIIKGEVTDLGAYTP